MKFQILCLFCLLYIGYLSTRADTLDNYQIYVGKTLKLREADFNPLRFQLAVLNIDSSINSEVLAVSYNHCTARASERKLKLTNKYHETIITWEFEEKEQHALMTIPIHSILEHDRIFSNQNYSLFYCDEKSPQWILLTPVHIGSKPLKKIGKPIKTDLPTLSIGIVAGIISLLIFIYARKRKRKEIKGM